MVNKHIGLDIDGVGEARKLNDLVELGHGVVLLVVQRAGGLGQIQLEISNAGIFIRRATGRTISESLIDVLFRNESTEINKNPIPQCAENDEIIRFDLSHLGASVNLHIIR